MTYLTVPISGKNLQSCKEQIGSAVRAGAEMLELRTDYIESLNIDKLKELIAYTEQTSLPVIVTCRDSAQGGQNNLSADLRKQILIEAVKLGADLIDCEFANFLKDDFGNDIKKTLAGNKKTRLILSEHNFKEPFENLAEIYEEMYSVFPEAIAKTAYQANHINDCFAAFDIMHEYGGKAIAICMGPAGIISRIITKKLGAFLTFASTEANTQTAPGQLTIEKMKKLYRYDTINKETEIFGVIADPVGHSISPQVHNACFATGNMNKVYLPLWVAGGQMDFNSFLDNVTTRKWLDFKGFSVTIPHKVNALEYAQKKGEYIEPVAIQIGAVNTLVIRDNERITGYNTDYAGAMDALTQVMGISKKQLKGKSIAVLGAGGVARAIVAGLADVGAKITIYNRTMEKARGLAGEFKCHFAQADEIQGSDAEIIINCTSIGMYPKTDVSPLPTKCLNASQTIFDTVYNPLETLLLKQAKQAGAKTVNGAEMFINQAAEQFKMFTQCDCPMEVIRKAVLNALTSKI
ncbi:MAG: shikimate dehydrogenase [Planctomycetes bacterium GWF2_41_51]|nr:MAG: shikimate dehydrogenase [Planctomycetes bacterium GWF2_41_51]HBG25994.1 shikimate dehydrogenase [Phycisphaerales bacterium]